MGDEHKAKVEELAAKLKAAREAAHTKEPYAMSESEKRMLKAFIKIANAIHDPHKYCIRPAKGED